MTNIKADIDLAIAIEGRTLYTSYDDRDFENTLLPKLFSDDMTGVFKEKNRFNKTLMSDLSTSKNTSKDFSS